MTGNYENRAHDNVILLVGDNEFETGILTVPANTTIAAGTIVQKASGKFVLSEGEATEVSLAVVVTSETNATGSNVDIPCRVAISGKVNKKALKISSAAATDAQADLVRKFGLVPVVVNEVGKHDNA